MTRLPKPIDPRLTNVVATVAVVTNAPVEVVIATLGVASTALAGLAPSPVQRPGA